MIIHPPAPAPPWENTPLNPILPEPDTGWLLYVLIFIILLSAIAILYKFWKIRFNRTNLKAQELKLRNQILEYLGAETGWLSADEIGKRFQEISDKPKNYSWMIAELHKIERLRYMKSSRDQC
jgi:hypothetical protein